MRLPKLGYQHFVIALLIALLLISFSINVLGVMLAKMDLIEDRYPEIRQLRSKIKISDIPELQNLWNLHKALLYSGTAMLGVSVVIGLIAAINAIQRTRESKPTPPP